MLKVLDGLKKLIKVITLFLKDEDSLVFYLMEEKAYRCLNDCFKLSIRITEEIEDLITEKSKRFLKEGIKEIWIKNVDTNDIQKGNDLPDDSITKRVMREKDNTVNN